MAEGLQRQTPSFVESDREPAEHLVNELVRVSNRQVVYLNLSVHACDKKIRITGIK